MDIFYKYKLWVDKKYVRAEKIRWDWKRRYNAGKGKIDEEHYEARVIRDCQVWTCMLFMF